MIFQKLIGLAIIVVAFTVLFFVSSLQPPTFVQISVALVGSFICLCGIVVLFSENQIDLKKILRKSSPKVG